MIAKVAKSPGRESPGDLFGGNFVKGGYFSGTVNRMTR